jgi:ADP-heptose:LPS heptosyltransferase
MHVATVKTALEWNNRTVVPGDYYLEDHNSAELLWASRCLGDVVISGCPSLRFDPVKIWRPGTRVLFVRVGGFGDLLWLAPIYQKMREAGVYVAHCCFERYAPVLEGFVDEVVPYPLAFADTTQFDQIVWLENVIEGKACLGNEHPAGRLAKLLHAPEGLPRAGYIVTGQEIEWAADQWPRTDLKRICVQVGSSGSIKDYARITELLAVISLAGFELLLVGDPREAHEKVPPGVFDCTMRQFTVRQSIAMASWCDAIVAPDSMFVHVGAALGIPTVGLYGPFAGSAYMDGFVGCAMQGRAKCSPCSWHPRGAPFPPGGPCASSGHCNALANVPPEDILFMLKRLLKK